MGKRTPGITSFLTGLFIALWQCVFVFSAVSNHSLSYITVGTGLCVMCLTVGILIFVQAKVTRFFFSIVVFSNLLITISFLFFEEAWLYLIASIFQGLLLGQVMNLNLRVKDSDMHAIVFSWVVVIAYLYTLTTCLIFSDIIMLTYVTCGVLSILLLVLFILLLRASNYDIKNVSTSYNTNALYKSPVLGVSVLAILIVVEIALFSWALLLPDMSQPIFNKMVLPVTAGLILGLRYFVKNRARKQVDLGWLFVMLLFLTVSIGMYYTMDQSFMFLLFFPTALVSGQFIAKHLFPILHLHSFFGMLFILLAIIMVVAGLYVDNHISYIVSIKMPENLLNLSALQAWIKELASLVAVALILTGVLYLRRKPAI